MRILVVHNRYRSSSPSGEDRVVDQEHEALTDAGHEVQRFERHSDDIATLPVRRRALVPLQVVWNRGAGRDLDRVLDAFAPDVVHLHNLFPLLSPSVLKSCQDRRVPCVVTLHNYRLICPGSTLYRTGSPCRDCVGLRFATPGVRHGCYRQSPAATLPIAISSAVHRRIWQDVPAAYVFLSEAQRRELEPLGFPPTRCFVKPNFVPPAPTAGTPENLIVYLGRLTEAKGLRVLMEAWDSYRGRGRAPGLRLAIAGSGPLEADLRSWARTRPTVDVLGLLDRSACTELVQRARAVVAPSEWPEPFGLVVAEAMAAGVVPVATAHGSFADMITDGVNGFCYPPGAPDTLARTLERIEELSGDQLDRIRAAARQTYDSRFVRSDNVARIEAIYQFAIDHPRGGSPGLGAEPGPRWPMYQAIT